MDIMAKLDEMEKSVSDFLAGGAGLVSVLVELKSALSIASAAASVIAPETGISTALTAIEDILDTVTNAVNNIEKSAQSTSAAVTEVVPTE